jgi:hypothetical protein
VQHGWARSAFRGRGKRSLLWVYGFLIVFNRARDNTCSDAECVGGEERGTERRDAWLLAALVGQFVGVSLPVPAVQLSQEGRPSGSGPHLSLSQQRAGLDFLLNLVEMVAPERVKSTKDLLPGYLPVQPS